MVQKHSRASYYCARYYDPSAGRFISEDPVDFRGRDINLYRYVRNHPSAYSDPIGLVTIDPTFNEDCLPALKRALDIVRRLPKKCDCAFKQIGSHRSLTELVDDLGITIQSEAHDEKSGTSHQGGYTVDGDPHNIWLRPIACRLGRWTLAQVLVHELVHITLVPGEGQEDQAYGMATYCGLSPLSTSTSVGVTAPGSLPPEPSHYSAPNTLVEP